MATNLYQHPSVVNAERQQRLNLESAAMARRRRGPELTVGVLIIAVFALLGTWFYTRSVDHDSVLALRTAVERGAVVTADDLEVVTIGSDDQLNVLDETRAGDVIGQVTLSDLSPGTLITTDHLAASAGIEPGDGIVGLALDPGEYPTPLLRPGDIVRVVAVAASADGEPVIDAPLAVDAEIVDIAPIGVQHQLFVSLAVDTDAADAIARASALGRVRLIQVAGS